jgi:hypothetical protein
MVNDVQFHVGCSAGKLPEMLRQREFQRRATSGPLECSRDDASVRVGRPSDGGSG